MGKKRFWNRKAVSPLIATVLLMAFAVALGAVVMTWGKDYVEATTSEVSTTTMSTKTCALDVSADIMRIGSQTTLCVNYQQHYVEFIINNRGSKIEDLQVSLIGKENSVFTNSSVLKTPIDQAGVRKVSVNYNPADAIEPLQQIIITPKIRISGQSDPIYCTQKFIEYDIIDKCT